MMKVVMPETMRKLDKQAMQDFRVPGTVLMENAGKAVADAVDRAYQKQCFTSKKVYIFCGKGNNGGDGFVAARHLKNKGFSVEIFIPEKKESIAGDALINLTILEKMNVSLNYIFSNEQLSRVYDLLKKEDGNFALIDALFGTGLKGDIEGRYKEVINLINKTKGYKVAVDIPSGICGRTGKVLGEAVKADETVTMGLLKPGLLLYPGAVYAGKVTVADIVMPVDLIEEIGPEGILLNEDFIKDLFIPYPPNVHKGFFGKVFIIAGSKGLTGAAALCALAAQRSGAGLVTLGVPESLTAVFEVKLTEVMKMPLPDQGGCISLEALDRALEFSQKVDVVAVGPGLSTNENTKKFIREFVINCKKPLVLDADGINAFQKHPDLLRGKEGDIIITPHSGELARLLNTVPLEIEENRWQKVVEAADEFNCTVVLKGARTLIKSPSSPVYINPTGNPGMATGGSGDVLTGMIAAFLARNREPLKAACAGVYIHGLAGDIAREKKGEFSLIAGDILDNLPEAFKRIF